MVLDSPRNKSLVIAWSVSGGLVLVAVVMLIIDLVKIPQSRPSLPKAPPGSSTAAGVVVARTEALNFFTLDYQQVDKDLQAVLALSTEPFTGQYAKNLVTLKTGIVSKQIVSTATVSDNATAIEYEAPGKVVVIVGVDSTSTAKGKTSESNRYRMRLTVVFTKGHWLVSSIEQVN